LFSTETEPKWNCLLKTILPEVDGLLIASSAIVLLPLLPFFPGLAALQIQVGSATNMISKSQHLDWGYPVAAAPDALRYQTILTVTSSLLFLTLSISRLKWLRLLVRESPVY